MNKSTRKSSFLIFARNWPSLLFSSSLEGVEGPWILRWDNGGDIEVLLRDNLIPRLLEPPPLSCKDGLIPRLPEPPSLSRCEGPELCPSGWAAKVSPPTLQGGTAIESILGTVVYDLTTPTPKWTLRQSSLDQFFWKIACNPENIHQTKLLYHICHLITLNEKWSKGIQLKMIACRS